MRWPRRREAWLIEPWRAVSTRVMELEKANEILVEVFHARPADVGEMMQRRLEEWSWDEGRDLARICPG